MEGVGDGVAVGGGGRIHNNYKQWMTGVAAVWHI